MRTIKAILSGTKVDTQGESISLQLLERMAEQSNEYYVPMGWDHDPRNPPYGRVIHCEVVPDGDRHYRLEGTIELWTEGDTVDSVPSDGRRFKQRPLRRDVEIWADISYDDPAGKQLVRELSEALKARERYHAKKAALPFASLTLWLGTHPLAAIAAGFLAKVGADGWDAAKMALGKIRTVKEEHVLIFESSAELSSGRFIDIEALISNRQSIDTLDKALLSLDGATQLAVTAHQQAVRLVFEWKSGKWELLYAVYPNGVPSVVRILTDHALVGRGLSMGGVGARVRK